MIDRKPEDYPKAYENSLDAQAIHRMLGWYKQRLSGLALAQARGAVESILGMLKHGEWLDERDALVARLFPAQVDPDKLSISPEHAARLLTDILAKYPALRPTVTGDVPTMYVIQLHDASVAVADTMERAQKMGDAVRANEDERTRYVFIRDFKLNEWPKHWAGKEPA